ncbi:hypothetical protein ZWY2020_052399 [Hordeum vulgare]|nr:hypothetical protein ZWY2020_052399 [Hordeum vulgare]
MAVCVLLLRPSLDALFFTGFTEDVVAASIRVTVQWFVGTLSDALAASSPAIGLADASTPGVLSAPWSLYIGLLQRLLRLLRLPPLPNLLLAVGLHFRRPSRFTLQHGLGSVTPPDGGNVEINRTATATSNDNAATTANWPIGGKDPATSPSTANVQQQNGKVTVVWLAGAQSDAFCWVVAEVIAIAIGANIADIKVVCKYVHHPIVVREVLQSCIAPPAKQTPSLSMLLIGSAARDAKHTTEERDLTDVGPMALVDNLDATMMLGHNRGPTRQNTPPASPPLSPTSVMRTPSRSKCDTIVTPVMDAHLCSPTTLLPPLIEFSLARPPGFEASLTPTLNYIEEM